MVLEQILPTAGSDRTGEDTPPPVAGKTRLWAAVAALAIATGCGTTRMTDTRRTATEQLLISDAIDRAVDRLDLTPLAGRAVYLNTTPLEGQTDREYLVSTLRQKLLATGCVIKEKPDEAEYVVEARSGGIGTDSRNVILGVPSVNIPPALAAIGGAPGVPAIPEVPLIKKTDQRGMVKLALFAYDRRSGRAVWQSGASPVSSSAKDTWIFGAGPFQWGTIYDGPQFAGAHLPIPQLLRGKKDKESGADEVRVAETAVFREKGARRLQSDVQLAGHVEASDDEPQEQPSDEKPQNKSPDNRR